MRLWGLFLPRFPDDRRNGGAAPLQPPPPTTTGPLLGEIFSPGGPDPAFAVPFSAPARKKKKDQKNPPRLGLGPQKKTPTFGKG